MPQCRYWSRQYGYGYWCYEIAGDELPEDSSAWAKSFMTDDPSEHEWLEYCDVTIGRYRAARIQDGKLISCLFIAPEHKQLPEKNWLQALFREQTLQKIQRACLLAGKSAGDGADPGPVVCSCYSIGKNRIIQAILEKDLVSVEAIGDYLRAGTNCGSCIPELRQLLARKSAANAA